MTNMILGVDLMRRYPAYGVYPGFFCSSDIPCGHTEWSVPCRLCKLCRGGTDINHLMTRCPVCSANIECGTRRCRCGCLMYVCIHPSVGIPTVNVITIPAIIESSPDDVI